MKRLAPLAALLLLVACDDNRADAPPVYVVEVEGETFRIAPATRQQQRRADSLLASGEDVIVYGVLARGDGGFNAPFHWHMTPESLDFVDVTVEVCSGRPMSDVEADLDYWIDTLGYYCPWGARIVDRVGF